MTDDLVTAAPSEAAGATEQLSDAERQFEAIRLSLSRRRRELGLSMSELARTIGVSPSMVSQIERGQSLPSVATLFALAAALGATVDTFFASALEDRGQDVNAAVAAPRAVAGDQPQGSTVPRERLYVVRKGHRASIDIKGGVHWERLTPESLDEVEFLELVYQPYAQSDATLYRHPGVEMVLVLEGRFEISIGFESYALEPGDSIQFPSSLPHRYVNPTGAVARAVTTIVRQPNPAIPLNDGYEQAVSVDGRSAKPSAL
jgi:transcriptional regulator with XRE-family HTH domain